MDRWLLFDLLAPMASFGGPAPGSVRDTEVMPTRGALLGLVAAALGIRRDEPEQLQGLGDALQFAVRARDARSILRDYHTVQTPKEAKIRGRPRMTRRDELAMPRHELNTVLSDRFYIGDFEASVAVQSQSPDWSLDAIAEALARPRFVLYLGRKSCPLQWPLDPLIVDATDWRAAFSALDEARTERKLAWQQSRYTRPLAFLPLSGRERAWSYAWDGAWGAQGIGDAHWVLRRDDPGDRQLWLFSERGHWRARAPGGAP